MITAPSSRPSRFEPQSPMKTDAGWKLWTRKPSAAPAVIAASTPAASRPRSKAMIAKATAEIAQTPAARPSTPSEKLTTFITATMPSTVSGPPKSPNSSAPRNGKVMFSTTTPALTSTSAASTWPASLAHGRQVAHVVDRADDGDQRRGDQDPARALVVGHEDERGDQHAARRSPGRRAAASPRCARPRSFISSTAPMRRASRATTGRQSSGRGERDEGGVERVASPFGSRGSQGRRRAGHSDSMANPG